MSALEHPYANRPYPTGQTRCILAEASPAVETARAELLGSDDLAVVPWSEVPPSPSHPAFAERPRPPTGASRTKKEGLPRAPTDDQLLNALDGFATLILSGADLPHDICSLSVADLLDELGRRGVRISNAGRLLSLSGQTERLVRMADREAALEPPQPPALELRRNLIVLREELTARLGSALCPSSPSLRKKDAPSGEEIRERGSGPTTGPRR